MKSAIKGIMISIPAGIAVWLALFYLVKWLMGY